MSVLIRRALYGAAAGAVGTTALNAATYLDMAVRGRPASDTPEQSVATLAEHVHVPIPGDDEERGNRLSGLGPLLGVVNGVGTGVVVSLLRPALGRDRWPVNASVSAALAMLGSNLPMKVLGVTDPGQWSAAEWAADVVPHLAYGAAVASTLHDLDC
jgi:hypothetical protein